MLLVAIAILAPSATSVWRCHEEVRAVVSYRSEPVIATSGGVLHRTPAGWLPLGTNAPAGLRALLPEGGSLTGTAVDGRTFRSSGRDWVAGSPTQAAPVTVSSADLSAESPDGNWRSYWGDTFLWKRQGDRWLQDRRRPPADGDYAILPVGNELMVGTSQGLYQSFGDRWVRANLPSQLPLVRPHGLARVGSQWVVGGLTGLWMGRPGTWQFVDASPVRQIIQRGGDVWVLFGNGALDKLQPQLNRRFSDVLHGASRRDWASCVALSATGILVGGQGGWIEKAGNQFVERYPKELSGQVVTTLLADGDARYVGTQKGGLFRFDAKGCTVWNPGRGLSDTWVTALLPIGNDLWVATATAGLWRLRDGRISAFPSPTTRPRHLLATREGIIAGGMEGAFRWDGQRWETLPTLGEETTAVTTVGNKTSVVTAQGVFFLKPDL